MVRKLRLLVVDDCAADRLLVKTALADAFPDASLQAVGSTRNEFQAILDDDEFDLLVADYTLGWADGFEVMSRVRQRWPGCRAILFTGMPSDKLFARAINAGFDACLTKDAGMEPLAAAVGAALASEARIR